MRWPGSGFDTVKVSRPAIALEVMLEAERLKQLARQIFALVGADREPGSCRRQSLERINRTGEGPAFGCDVGLVVNEKIGQHLIDVPFGAGATQGLPRSSRGRQSLRQSETVSAETARMAAADQRIVQGVGKVGRSVDEGAVEIENDRRISNEQPHFCHSFGLQ